MKVSQLSSILILCAFTVQVHARMCFTSDFEDTEAVLDEKKDCSEYFIDLKRLTNPIMMQIKSIAPIFDTINLDQNTIDIPDDMVLVCYRATAIEDKTGKKEYYKGCLPKGGCAELEKLFTNLPNIISTTCEECKGEYCNAGSAGEKVVPEIGLTIIFCLIVYIGCFV